MGFLLNLCECARRWAHGAASIFARLSSLAVFKRQEFASKNPGIASIEENGVAADNTKDAEDGNFQVELLSISSLGCDFAENSTVVYLGGRAGGSC
jgi:hypothetical protein